jgi:hypothetical protein
MSRLKLTWRLTQLTRASATSGEQGNSSLSVGYQLVLTPMKNPPCKLSATARVIASERGTSALLSLFGCPVQCHSCRPYQVPLTSFVPQEFSHEYVMLRRPRHHVLNELALKQLPNAMQYGLLGDAADPLPPALCLRHGALCREQRVARGAKDLHRLDEARTAREAAAGSELKGIEVFHACGFGPDTSYL